MCFNTKNPDYCKLHKKTKMKNGVCHVCVFNRFPCDVDFNTGGFVSGKVTDVFISDGESIINLKDFTTSATSKEIDRDEMNKRLKGIHRTVNFRIPISDLDVAIEANFYLMRPETKN